MRLILNVKQNLFYNAYTRTKVFLITPNFHPKIYPSDDELKILEKYRGKIPDEVFTSVYTPPNTAEENGLRKNLRIAEDFNKRGG